MAKFKDDSLFKTIKESVASSIHMIQDSYDLSEVEISRELGLSSNSVNRWMDQKTGSQPRAVDLYRISKRYDVSIDWFLGDRDELIEGLAEVTYADMFMHLRLLEKNEIIEIEDNINDPFLSYLLRESKRIDNSPNIKPERKAKWYQKVLKDYHVRLLNRGYANYHFQCEFDMCQDVDEYTSYLNTLNSLVKSLKQHPHWIPEQPTYYGNEAAEEEQQMQAYLDAQGETQEQILLPFK